MDRFANEPLAYLQRKLFWVFTFVSLAFCAFVYRLYDLQIQQGEHYDEVATGVFVRQEELVAPRGPITDRNGKILAATRDYYQIAVIPQSIENRDQLISSLGRLLGIPSAIIKDKLYEARFEAKFRPVVIVDDASYDQVSLIRQYRSPELLGASLDLSGVEVIRFPVREYLFPELFAHALGYLTEVTQDQLDRAREKRSSLYSLGDLVGAAGVEKAYDEALKGQDGWLGKVVNARGRRVSLTQDLKVLEAQASREPRAGLVLRSTLDFEAQKAAAKALGDRKGAVVALDPQQGDVIALYSSPSYNPNRITKNVDRAYWAKINLDEDRYLFNRAIQAMYPPASTYKTVVLAAGLEEGIVDPKKTKHNCYGGISFGNRFFKCWRAGGHGRVDAKQALAQSCDVFFYRVGEKLGVDGIAKYARHFGLGQTTQIEIPFEQAGLIPTQLWKQKRYQQEWVESETLSVAIGQSFNLTTPLQNAVMAAMIANDGDLILPRLGLEVRDGDTGEVVRTVERRRWPSPLQGRGSLQKVREGMIEVIHGPRGTARRLRKSPHKIAGKTGTAQVVSHSYTPKPGENIDPHGLFIAFAPYDNPQIVVSVIVENGRGGSSAAAPVAHAVIDAFLEEEDDS